MVRCFTYKRLRNSYLNYNNKRNQHHKDLYTGDKIIQKLHLFLCITEKYVVYYSAKVS